MTTPCSSVHSEVPQGSFGPAERHYSPSEVAERWNLNAETIRRIFQDEPGILVFQSPVKKGRRPYKTIRIPESVLERVHRRLQR